MNYDNCTKAQLLTIANEMGVDSDGLNKAKLLEAIKASAAERAAQQESPAPETAEGSEEGSDAEASTEETGETEETPEPAPTPEQLRASLVVDLAAVEDPAYLVGLLTGDEPMAPADATVAWTAKVAEINAAISAIDKATFKDVLTETCKGLTERSVACRFVVTYDGNGNCTVEPVTGKAKGKRAATSAQPNASTVDHDSGTVFSKAYQPGFVEGAPNTETFNFTATATESGYRAECVDTGEIVGTYNRLATAAKYCIWSTGASKVGTEDKVSGSMNEGQALRWWKVQA
jgi:hypothetical protein